MRLVPAASDRTLPSSGRAVDNLVLGIAITSLLTAVAARPVRRTGPPRRAASGK